MKRLWFAIIACGLVAAAFFGLVRLIQLADLMHSGSFVERDFTQDYLMAKAIVAGLDPGLPVPEIGRRLGLDVPGYFLDHASPHPPPFALALTPLALLSYGDASLVWIALSLLCLAVAVYLLGMLRGTPLGLLQTGLFVLGLVLWDPVYADLSQGQVNCLLLVLLTGTLLFLRAGKQNRAGVLMGAALLVKPMVWPVALVLLLHRQSRALVAVAATVAVGYAVSAAFLGPAEILAYLTQTAPAMGGIYRLLLHNISLFSLGPKLFEGISVVEANGGILALPPLLFSWPAAGQAVGGLLAGGLVGAELVLARRLPLQGAVAVAVCVAILVSPVAWTHYLVLCLIPLAVSRMRLPTAVVALVLLAVPYAAWMTLSLSLFGSVAYLMMMPIVAVLFVIMGTALTPSSRLILSRGGVEGRVPAGSIVELREIVDDRGGSVRYGAGPGNVAGMEDSEEKAA